MRYQELKIVEALKPSEYRNLVKGWDQKRYAEIFLNPKYKHDRKGYRVYLPMQSDPDQQSKEKSNTQLQIEQFLRDNGFQMLDYVKGIVYNVEKKQNIKIGKVLNKLKRSDLLNAFNVDKTREAKQSKYVAVISRHPYDIAGQSTDRGWKSCMNLHDGINRHYVPLDIREGTLVAYVTRSDDLDLKNPTGRVSIKPFVDILGKPQIYFGIEEQVYGTNVPGFIQAVTSWVNEVNRAHELDEVAIMKFNPELYRDSGLASKEYVTKKGMSDQEKQKVKYIRQDPGRIFDTENPTDDMLAVAIYSDRRGRVFSQLMQRPEFSPSDKVQLAAVTANGKNLITLLDNGATPSEKTITTAISHIPRLIFTLKDDYPQVKIPNSAKEIALEKQPALLSAFDVTELSKETLFKVLKYPENLDLLFDKVAVNKPMILTALNYGYNMFDRIIDYCQRNNIKIDSEMVNSALKHGGFRNLSDILKHNYDYPEKAVPFDDSHIQLFLVPLYVQHDYREARDAVERMQNSGVTFDDSLLYDIVKKTKSVSILYDVKEDISEKLASACIEIDGRAIQFIDNPSPALQKHAVESNAYSIKYINNPTDEAITISLQKAPYLIEELPAERLNLSVFAAVAKHKMKVNWDQGDSDLFPDMGEFLEKMEESGLSDNDIQKIISLSVKTEPHRIFGLMNYSDMRSFITDDMIINAAGKTGRASVCYQLFNVADIMPPVEALVTELKTELLDANKLMRGVEHLNEKIDNKTLAILAKAIPDIAERSMAIIYAIIGKNLSEDPDPKLIKYALENYDRGLWALERILSTDLPIKLDYIKAAFGQENLDSSDVRRVFVKLKRKGLDIYNKELIEYVFEPIKTLQDAVMMFLAVSNEIKDTGDESLVVKLIKRFPELVQIVHLATPKTQAMIDAAFESGGFWEPLSPGDLVRLSNPRARPKFKIDRITDDGYEISLDGDPKGVFPRKRIHQVNGLTPPKGYEYPK